MTTLKQTDDKPEDKMMSSGYSFINNYKNVSNFIERKTTSYSFWDEIELIGKEEYPQGICITEKYVFVSAYSGMKSHMGYLKIFDKKNGELVLTLGMDEHSHMGGVAFDGVNIWVCNSSKMAIERISYSFIEKMVEDNLGKMIDARHLTELFLVKNIPSTITYFDGQLWIATHSVLTNSIMNSYVYTKEDENINMIGSFSVPKKVQGVTFSENGEVYLSTSYGRTRTSYIKHYTSINAMSNDTNDILDEIELPPCSEGLIFLDDKLYIIFESAGTKYLEGTDGKGKSSAPLDKILIISTS